MRLLNAFEAHQRAQAQAVRTIEGRRQVISYLARRTGQTPTSIERLDLEGHLGRGIAPSSMQRERSDMRAFFRWAKREHHLPKDPSKRLQKVTVPRNQPRPLTMAQAELILGCGVYRKTRTMILLAVYQGLRAHEIAKFHGFDIDLVLGTLRVVGKGSKERILPLHEMIRAEAARYPSEGWWFPSRLNPTGHVTRGSVSDLFSRAIRRAGIRDPRITGHSFRHTFATELVEAGLDIRVVQVLMRHDSLNSTQIYTAASERRQRDGIALLPTVVVPTHSGRLAA